MKTGVHESSDQLSLVDASSDLTTEPTVRTGSASLPRAEHRRADIEHCPFWSISLRLIDRCVGYTSDVAASGGAVMYRVPGDRDQHNSDRSREPHGDDLERPDRTRPVPRFVPSRRRGVSVGVNSGGSRSASIPQELPQTLANVGNHMELRSLCFRRSRSRNGADCQVSDPPRSVRGVLERPPSKHRRCRGSFRSHPWNSVSPNSGRIPVRRMKEVVRLRVS